MIKFPAFLTRSTLALTLLLFTLQSKAQEASGRSWVNFQLGGAGSGMYAKVDGTNEEFYWGYYSIRPRIGIFITRKLEIGASSEFSWQRGSKSLNVEVGEGAALGYYARYSFNRWNLFDLIVKENKARGELFPYVEFEQRWQNIIYDAEQPGKVGFTDSYSMLNFRPKIGLLVGAKSFYVNAGLTYNYLPDAKIQDPSPLQLLLGLEYHL